MAVSRSVKIEGASILTAIGLSVILCVLKLLHIISWPWWVVATPMILLGGTVLCVAAALLYLFMIFHMIACEEHH